MTKISSAQQIEISDLEVSHSRGDRTNSSAPRLNAQNAADTQVAPSTLSVPNFGARPEWYATAARLAGRVNAASISDQEHEALLRDRAALLDKVFDETITRQEANHLEYVEWQLDRIEDARHGSALDMLEDHVVEYERFVANMADLKEQLVRHAKRRR